MPRPRTKDYVIVSLSIHKDILEEIDKMRGSKSRTEFIESLILNSKDKLDLIAEIEALRKELEEVKHENEVLRAKLKLVSQRVEKEKLEELINEKFEELKKMYLKSLEIWDVYGDAKGKTLALFDVIKHVKEQWEIDEITRMAIGKLLEYVGLNNYKEKIDEILNKV